MKLYLEAAENILLSSWLKSEMIHQEILLDGRQEKSFMLVGIFCSTYTAGVRLESGEGERIGISCMPVLSVVSYQILYIQ
ncbi:hypothetical protein [Candidatus Nitrososphaera evergladensis]|nr:hypothetical protein [Candidatus Nitrososphaera evergladensis]